MFCSTCGKTLRGDVSACPHCGAAVGESRFEGHTYTGAQMRLKPGEAVRLPVSHTKTTYMGKMTEPDEETDARTTYRATAEKVHGYEEFDEGVYDDTASYDTPEAAEELDEPEFDGYEAQEPVFDAAEDEEPAQEEPAESGYGPEAGSGEVFDDRQEDEEEKPVSRKKRRLARKAPKAPRDEESENEEPEEDPGELSIREIKIDSDADLAEEMRRYLESGRYDDELEDEEPARAKAARKDKKKKKSGGGLFGFRKRSRDVDFDSLTPDDFEIAEEENPFELDDLTEEEAENAGENTGFEYADLDGGDEANADADMEYGSAEDEEAADPDEEEAVDLDDEEIDEEALDEEIEEMERRQYGRGLDPKIKGILKYAVFGVLLIAVAVAVIMGLSRLTDETKKSPIDGVTYELYQEGVSLMKSRADAAYRNALVQGYDGSDSKLLSVMNQLTIDLDSLQGMMPENPQVNDQRFISAMIAIQNNINNSITNDLLNYTDSSKPESQKQAEAESRWSVIAQTVEAFSGATSTAQLDAIIKGEKIEVIQKTTPAPEPTATPVPYQVLSKGSKGDEVRKLQTRLSDLGYLNGEVDGIFGNDTKTALQLFQKAIGEEADGIADVDTQIALFSEDAPRKN